MPDFLVDADEFATLTTSILSEGQVLRFQARGDSMRPFIKNGDLVEVHAVSKKVLVRGDVALCRLENGRLVVHRVIKVNKDSLLLQGDALHYTDGLVSQENVLGRVDKVDHHGKSIQLDRPWLRFLVSLWLPLTVLHRLGYQIIEGVRRIRKLILHSIISK